ncbi:hypothetical protein HBI14_109530 [Parastagonospora nodorum]|nr:hypothetical protein HBI14_109530 [Parastagonospora nodorum]
MPSMKIALLAMASAVVAVPHVGHDKFHHRRGAAKPYPNGGWGNTNSTAVAYATGYPTGGSDSTIDVTSTSTTTLKKTVTIKASSTPVAAAQNVPTGAGGDDQCGPATVTVTASEKVTVTVTPGGGAGVPSSSAPAAAESYGNGYGASSPAAVVPTPAVPEVKTSSKVEEAKTTPAPEKPSSAAASLTPASSYPEYAASSVVIASSVAPSSAAASSAAPSPSAGTGNGYSGSKRGLAYNEAALCKTFGSKFGFGYNWGQVENNDIGTDFIPMMHGPSKSSADEWLANVDKAAKKGSKAVMGFNECDHASQCNMSPEAACASWKTYMNPIASSHPDMTIIGPSVTNGPKTDGMGLAWLSKFHEVCPDAVVHASNIHFYDIYNEGTVQRFKDHVEEAAKIYGKPVWVTEFGLNPGSASEDQAASFLKECMAYLDSSDKVQGYSWFMVGSGENQLNSGNGLSKVGQVYAAY